MDDFTGQAVRLSTPNPLQYKGNRRECGDEDGHGDGRPMSRGQRAERWRRGQTARRGKTRVDSGNAYRGRNAGRAETGKPAAEAKQAETLSVGALFKSRSATATRQRKPGTQDRERTAGSEKERRGTVDAAKGTQAGQRRSSTPKSSVGAVSNPSAYDPAAKRRSSQFPSPLPALCDSGCQRCATASAIPSTHPMILHANISIKENRICECQLCARWNAWSRFSKPGRLPRPRRDCTCRSRRCPISWPASNTS